MDEQALEGPSDPNRTEAGQGACASALGPARSAFPSESLIQLLDDDSALVRREVRRELELRGDRALPHLARAARRGDARVRARARLLLLQAERQQVARRIARFASGARIDLERGLMLLSRFLQPRFDARGTLCALDAMGAEVAQRIERRAPGAERALELARYLGRELGFTGDDQDYHHPDNVYLHRVIERRRGLPLTLSAVYRCVARRAGLTASLVALPGHVVLRLTEIDRHVLIDPFDQGRVISERDCLSYLAGRGLAFRPQWFADAPDAELFERQVRNLRAGHRRRGLSREAEQLDLILGALARRPGRAATPLEAP